MYIFCPFYYQMSIEKKDGRCTTELERGEGNPTSFPLRPRSPFCTTATALNPGFYLCSSA